VARVMNFPCKFPEDYDSEIILKIGQHKNMVSWVLTDGVLLTCVAKISKVHLIPGELSTKSSVGTS